MDEQVLPTRRLPRVQGDILHDAVALVEDAENGDAPRHRRDATLSGRSRRRLFARDGGVLSLLAPPARGEA
jgi:hypothetical protein